MGEQAAKKVVILGGVNALETAFALTSGEDWRQRFSEISVYQIGWRLRGGPAPSGAASDAPQLDSQVWHDLLREEGKPPEPDGGNLPWDYVARSMQRVAGYWKSLAEHGGPQPTRDREDSRAWPREWVDYAGSFSKHLGGAIGDTKQTEALLDSMAQILEKTNQVLRDYAKSLSAGDEEIRQLWIPLDLILTVNRGVLRDGALIHGFDSLNPFDFREWLRRHRVAPITLRSAWIDELYVDRERLPTGAAVQRLFDSLYDDADESLRSEKAEDGLVFLPLYQVLHQRGVKFHFFHRLHNLQLTADGTGVAQVELVRQAVVGNGEYQPLIEQQGMSRWPDEPLYDQLVDGDKLRAQHVDFESADSDGERVVLKPGEQFDIVILGV